MDIYALGDPRTGDVHYIGIAQNVYRRFAQHLTARGENDKKDQWIATLKSAGIAPSLLTLESNVTREKIREREQFWIRYYHELGAPLANIQHAIVDSTISIPPEAKHYIPASECSQIVSGLLGRKVSARYIRKLSLRKKNPVRCIAVGNRWLYHRGDIEDCAIRERATPNSTDSAV